MNKGKVVLLVLAALVCVSLGFVVGQVVQATGNQPGSESDPLVSQSYVEKVIGEKMSVLQTQVEELQAEVAELKGETPTTGGNTSDNDDATPAVSDNTTDTNSNDDNDTAVSGKLVQVTADNVNIREEPSTDSEKIGSVSKNTKLKYLDTQNDWYKIELADGTVGWIAGFLCKIVTE